MCSKNCKDIIKENKMKASAHSFREKIRLAPWGNIGLGIVLATITYSFGASYPFRPFYLFFVFPAMLVNIINLSSGESRALQLCISSIALIFTGVLFPVVVQSFSIENPPQGFGWYVDCETLVKVLHYVCVGMAAWLSIEGYTSIPVRSGTKAERGEDDNDL